MNSKYDSYKIGMNLLGSLYGTSNKNEPETTLAETNATSVKELEVYGEKEMNLKHARYGKVLGLRGSTDFQGAQPLAFYDNDPMDWRGASGVPTTQLNRKFSNDFHTLLDDKELFDAPISFTPVITGAYRFHIGAHYPITENLLSYFHNNSQNSLMRRTTYNCEEFNIGGKIGDPYPHTGYDVMECVKHPFFWTNKPDEVANELISPRFPVSQLNSDKEAIITENVVVNETWGFPKTNQDAKDYFPLVAKIMGLMHNKPYDWDNVIAITSGFNTSESKYENAVKKLDFMRFLHDLHGKWIMFSTSPDVGKDMSILGITFADPEYFQNGAGWKGRRKLIKIDMNELILSEQETKIVELLSQRFGEFVGRPTETYLQLQKEIDTLLTTIN
ncbi:hypothetical protein KBC75_00665 [Candidatus Shapirobacteria bacterium]|nr:hypothetical protein [Candidatus Shapirobacteria bacterium]